MDKPRIDSLSIIRELLDRYRLEGENYEDTPRRYIHFFEDLLLRPKPTLTTFPLKGKPGMILIKNYVTWSLCPHHLLPVKYTIKIGYIPSNRVLGLSKLGRIADWVMSLLPLQEEISALICKELEDCLQPKGTGVLVTGEHLCMQMRGVKASNSIAVSDNMTGCFLEEGSTREEFLTL